MGRGQRGRTERREKWTHTCQSITHGLFQSLVSLDQQVLHQTHLNASQKVLPSFLTPLFFVFLDPTVVSEVYLHVGVSSHFAWGGAAAPWAAAASHSPMLRGAESGSLTCLIAFDSSLSSLVDQWSSVLFIRNINAPHIPTASATAQRVHPEREALFSESLLLLALRVPYFRIIAIVCFSWFHH